jgi:ACS family pantothenate transporter-like MFS transporter
MTRDSESTEGEVGAQQKTWKRHIWDTLDKSPKERRFLLKLDLTLLTFGCLGMSITIIEATPGQ